MIKQLIIRQKLDLRALEQLESYQRFKQAIRNALKKLNYLH
jgi:hypothetical protein